MPSLLVPDIVSNAKEPAPSKPILLVVDDEEGPRTSLRVVFKNDFEVLFASNGIDAIKLARSRPVDIAILDILMHGMSGVDVLRELKQLDEDIEVIMLTAYETLETARQALRLGAREYLNKPFDIAALRTAASKALAKRRANKELRSAHSRLEILQEELTTATTKQAKEGAGDTAGNILHDLNSPLTVINGFVELIHKQVQKAASLEGEELEKMKTSIARVHSQVVRCLEISKRYLGVRGFQDEVPDERVAVNEVLVDLQELLSKHPSAEGCELTISELDQHTHAAISGTNLLRVLINLALNGLQSTSTPTRVEVIAQCLAGHFDMTSFHNGTEERFVASDRLPTGGPMVAISVRDNGPGIPEEIVPKLFNERFTSKPVGKGSGLGLGSVKNLVTSAKGAIRLTTKQGQGTTFTVFLPLAS
jgi:two-component system, sensor histidine kinase and response regulator